MAKKIDMSKEKLNEILEGAHEIKINKYGEIVSNPEKVENYERSKKVTIADTFIKVNQLLTQEVQNSKILEHQSELKKLHAERLKIIEKAFENLRFPKSSNEFIKFIFICEKITSSFFNKKFDPDEYDQYFILKELIKNVKKDEVITFSSLTKEIDMKILMVDSLKIQNGYDVPRQLLFWIWINNKRAILTRTFDGKSLDFNILIQHSREPRPTDNEIRDAIEKIYDYKKPEDKDVRISPHRFYAFDYASLLIDILISFLGGVAAGYIVNKITARKVMRQKINNLDDNTINIMIASFTQMNFDQIKSLNYSQKINLALSIYEPFSDSLWAYLHKDNVVKLRCPECNKIFIVSIGLRPINMNCPHCGVKGIVK